MTLGLQNPFIRHLAAFFGSLTILLGLGWAIIKPHAENLILETTNDRIQSVNDRIDKVEQATNELGDKLETLSQQTGRNSYDLKALRSEQLQAKEDRKEIKGLVKDQRSLSQQILLELQKR